jgi:hypothetical protein
MFHRRRNGDTELSINTTLSIIHADVLDTRDELGEVRDKLATHMRESDEEHAEVKNELQTLKGKGGVKRGR